MVAVNTESYKLKQKISIQDAAVAGMVLYVITSIKSAELDSNIVVMSNTFNIFCNLNENKLFNTLKKIDN